jgi:hypothetical protein
VRRVDTDEEDVVEPELRDSSDAEINEASQLGEVDEEAYQKTKALGDADRAVRKALKKDERSSDLRTVFVQEKGRINPNTKMKEDGWWCQICKDAGEPAHTCFFKGSVSTLRTHIARNAKCHYPIYIQRCKERGVAIHPRAIPASCKTEGDQVQQTLDGILVPKIPQFTKAGLVDYIIELIVAEDEVC